MPKVKKIKENLLVEWDLGFIVESSESVTLYESEKKEGEGTDFLKLTGVFQKGNSPNGNRRVYETPLLAREVGRFQSKINNGTALGKGYHPGFFDPGGPAGLLDVSHRVTRVEMEENLVKGDLLVLKTAIGKDVEAIIDGGGKIGISSRGYGSMKRFDSVKFSGVEYKDVWVVQDDYRLETFDLVLTPSVKTAMMKPVKGESQEEDIDGDNNCNEDENIPEGGIKSMTIEELKASQPALYNQIHAAAVKEGREVGATEAQGQVANEHKVAVEALNKTVGELKVTNETLTTENVGLKKDNAELKAKTEKVEAEKLTVDIKAAIVDAVSKSTYKDYFKTEDIEYVQSISDSVETAGKEVVAREKVYENAIKTFKATATTDTKSKNTDTSEDNVNNKTNEASQKDFADSQRALAFG